MFRQNINPTKIPISLREKNVIRVKGRMYASFFFGDPLVRVKIWDSLTDKISSFYLKEPITGTSDIKFKQFIPAGDHMRLILCSKTKILILRYSENKKMSLVEQIQLNSPRHYFSVSPDGKYLFTLYNKHGTWIEAINIQSPKERMINKISENKNEDTIGIISTSRWVLIKNGFYCSAIFEIQNDSLVVTSASTKLLKSINSLCNHLFKENSVFLGAGEDAAGNFLVCILASHPIFYKVNRDLKLEQFIVIKDEEIRKTIKKVKFVKPNYFLLETTSSSRWNHLLNLATYEYIPINKDVIFNFFGEPYQTSKNSVNDYPLSWMPLTNDMLRIYLMNELNFNKDVSRIIEEYLDNDFISAKPVWSNRLNEKTKILFDKKYTKLMKTVASGDQSALDLVKLIIDFNALIETTAKDLAQSAQDFIQKNEIQQYSFFKSHPLHGFFQKLKMLSFQGVAETKSQGLSLS